MGGEKKTHIFQIIFPHLCAGYMLYIIYEQVPVIRVQFSTGRYATIHCSEYDVYEFGLHLMPAIRDKQKKNIVPTSIFQRYTILIYIKKKVIPRFINVNIIFDTCFFRLPLFTFSRSNLI